MVVNYLKPVLFFDYDRYCHRCNVSSVASCLQDNRDVFKPFSLTGRQKEMTLTVTDTMYEPGSSGQ